MFNRQGNKNFKIMNFIIQNFIYLLKVISSDYIKIDRST